jgi:hypothetical protein
VTTVDPADDSAPQTLEEARAVLLGIAATTATWEEHPLVARHCDEGALNKIVELAWRYQFSTDRLGFKKEVRELHDYVAAKVKESPEHTT